MRIEYLYRYPGEGSDRRGAGGGRGRGRRRIPWDRAFALAQGDSRVRPGAPAWLPKAQLHVPDEQRPDRRAVLDLRARAPACWRSARRTAAAVMENALTEAGRARIGAFLTGVPGGGGARRAAVPPRARPRVLRPAEQGGQPDQPGQPARLRGRASGAAATGGGSAPMSGSAARRPGRVRTGSAKTIAARRRGAAGDQAHRPLPGDRGEPGDRRSATPTRWRSCARCTGTSIWASMPR